MIEKKDANWFDKNMARLRHEFEIKLDMKKAIKPWSEALKITFYYLLIGGLWIVLSDKILEMLVKNDAVFKQIQLLKGWFYVVVTGAIFYEIIRRKLKLFENAVDDALSSYEDLSVAHEELIAMSEELGRQNVELENQKNAVLVSEQRYELAVDGSSDGIWDWDIKENIYFFSIKSKTVFGYEQDDMDNTIEAWKTLFHPEDWDNESHKLEQYLTSKDSVYENTYRLRCKDGQYRWILSRGKGVWDNEGNPIRIAGSHTDITEQIHLQESLRAAKELSESIILDAPMIILVLDKKGRIIKFNPYAEENTGYTENEVLGKNANDLFIPEHKKESRRDMFKEILNGVPLHNNEMDIICKNGNLLTVLWNNNLLHDPQGYIQGVVSIGIDITERRKMESQVHSLAYYDTLTGLPNRSLFEEEVTKQIEKLKGTESKAALIYMDVDDFKHINDTMGHSVGDLFIKQMAKILTAHIQSPHVLARFGGDEFAIFLSDGSDTSSLINSIKKIQEELRRPWILENKSFFVSVSHGIAIYPEHGSNFSTLMKNADTAMFHMKENGKDGFVVFEPAMYDSTLRYIQMSNELRNAIENKEFMLYYQPQLDLTNGNMIGVEALIRWNHPEKGFISPVEFIPFAEKTGYIVTIDEWVIETACKQKRIWEEQGYPNIKIAVNLSGQMVSETNSLLKIQDILKRCDMSYCDIELEVTETAVIKEIEKATEVLQGLKQLGISIALDDFGTGYSSLTYLQRLPLNILKIDREFIRNVIHEDEDAYIFKSIVELAHNLGLKVVAEGVETKEQKAFLMKNHCDIGQGYLFSKPVPPTEIVKLLSSNLNTAE